MGHPATLENVRCLGKVSESGRFLCAVRPRFDSEPRVFSVPGQNGNGRVTRSIPSCAFDVKTNPSRAPRSIPYGAAHRRAATDGGGSELLHAVSGAWQCRSEEGRGERGTIPVSVHPAVHIRTLGTRPSWTSPPELVPAEGFLLRYVSFQTAWRVRGAPGNLFSVFLWLPQGSLILHSFFTTAQVFCLARRNDLAESVGSET